MEFKKTKPKLYLLAGNGSAADWWDDLLPFLHDYEVVPLELPGYGQNRAPACDSIKTYAAALKAITEPNQFIFAVGVNALVVMHLLKESPAHFAHSFLLAPVGVFLWQRKLPKLMQPRIFRKAIHWALSHHPSWFAKRFSHKTWSTEQYRRMGEGYRRCRAFLPSWDFVNAYTATELLEWIDSPITLIWGNQDKLLAPKQAAAWSAVLARADLQIIFQQDWGHYPWIDDPQAFADWLDEQISTRIASNQYQHKSTQQTIYAHTKSGRLALAKLAGLPVPESLTLHLDALENRDNKTSLSQSAQAQINQFIVDATLHSPAQRFVVRSSSFMEDHADHANAGLSESVIDVTAQQVLEVITHLLAQNIEEVLLQTHIKPVISGVAFVRYLSAEIEWVNGHLASLAEGTATPQRVILSRLSESWQSGEFQTTSGLTQAMLWDFLQQVIATFHYVAGDIEWAWDGKQLWLFQYRPITEYDWQRHLTTANIEEILPPQPSYLVHYAQYRTAYYVAHILGRWDSAIFNQNEPFTTHFAGATYINNDLFLAQLYRFGLPSQLYAAEVGGAVPKFRFHLGRFLLAIPNLLLMLFQSRSQLRTLPKQLAQFDAELAVLESAIAQSGDLSEDSYKQAEQLANWFTHAYLGLVQSNLCIASALSTSGGALLGWPETAYQQLSDRESATHLPHRLPWETDPATPRSAYPAHVLKTNGLQSMNLQSLPVWPWWIRLADRLGLPGMRGYYLQVREWYRDNLMRLFFRLHHLFKQLPDQSATEKWFTPYPIARQPLGSFWQNGNSSTEIADSFVIYYGEITGILGEDILVENSLDPGRYATYQQARAVIAIMGGKLSHGSTLLRELKKPSAVIPTLDRSWIGKRVTLKGNRVSLVE